MLPCDDLRRLLSRGWPVLPLAALVQGSETKLEQAKLNLEELVERHGPSVLVGPLLIETPGLTRISVLQVYNALASCLILLRKSAALLLVLVLCTRSCYLALQHAFVCHVRYSAAFGYLKSARDQVRVCALFARNDHLEHADVWYRPRKWTK